MADLRQAGSLWTPEEDVLLLRHVSKYGTKHWGYLQSSGVLPHRDQKACCNRFILLKRKFFHARAMGQRLSYPTVSQLESSCPSPSRSSRRAACAFHAGVQATSHSSFKRGSGSDDAGRGTRGGGVGARAMSLVSGSESPTQSRGELKVGEDSAQSRAHSDEQFGETLGLIVGPTTTQQRPARLECKQEPDLSAETSASEPPPVAHVVTQHLEREVAALPGLVEGPGRKVLRKQAFVEIAESSASLTSPAKKEAALQQAVAAAQGTLIMDSPLVVTTGAGVESPLLRTVGTCSQERREASSCINTTLPAGEGLEVPLAVPLWLQAHLSAGDDCLPGMDRSVMSPDALMDQIASAPARMFFGQVEQAEVLAESTVAVDWTEWNAVPGHTSLDLWDVSRTPGFT